MESGKAAAAVILYIVGAMSSTPPVEEFQKLKLDAAAKEALRKERKEQKKKVKEGKAKEKPKHEGGGGAWVGWLVSSRVEKTCMCGWIWWWWWQTNSGVMLLLFLLLRKGSAYKYM